MVFVPADDLTVAHVSRHFQSQMRYAKPQKVSDLALLVVCDVPLAIYRFNFAVWYETEFSAEIPDLE